MTCEAISFDAFEQQYQPVRVPDADPRDGGIGSYRAFEPHNEADMAEVAAAGVARVWTVLDCDGELVIASGYHRVNRLHFVLTAVARATDAVIDVQDFD